MININLQPGGNDVCDTFVQLDGVRLFLTFRWLPRPAAWYVSAALADGTPVADTVRVTCGSPLLPDQSFPGAPPGLLFAIGNDDPYRQEQLGNGVDVVYLTAAEIA